MTTRAIVVLAFLFALGVAVTVLAVQQKVNQAHGCCLCTGGTRTADGELLGADRVYGPAAAGPRPWVLVGTGLTAAACVLALPPSVVDLLSIREQGGGMGGRAVTLPCPAALASTTAAPQDMGAWVFQPLLHPNTAAFMQAVRMSSVDVDLFVPDQSFIYDATSRVRRPFGTLAFVPAADVHLSLWAAGSGDELQWFAHTGLWPRDAPMASAAAVAAWDLPRFGRVPTAFGWQGAVLRALGPVPALVNTQLGAILASPTDGTVTLQYTNGTREEGVGAALLTMPPHMLAELGGVLPSVAKAATDGFVTVPAGVVYATWDSVDVWWPTVGWTAGTVATSMPLGRVCIVGANDIRLAMSGQAHVGFWNDLFSSQDTAVARQAVAAQLAEVFGVAVPVPVAAVFKPWARGTTLWRVDVDKAHTLATLRRPLGPSVPVTWGSADADPTWGGWVEGAVAQGNALAAAALALALAPASVISHVDGR